MPGIQNSIERNDESFTGCTNKIVKVASELFTAEIRSNSKSETSIESIQTFVNAIA